MTPARNRGNIVIVGMIVVVVVGLLLLFTVRANRRGNPQSEHKIDHSANVTLADAPVDGTGKVFSVDLAYDDAKSPDMKIVDVTKSLGALPKYRQTAATRYVLVALDKSDKELGSYPFAVPNKASLARIGQPSREITLHQVNFSQNIPYNDQAVLVVLRTIDGQQLASKSLATILDGPDDGNYTIDIIYVIPQDLQTIYQNQAPKWQAWTRKMVFEDLRRFYATNLGNGKTLKLGNFSTSISTQSSQAFATDFGAAVTAQELAMTGQSFRQNNPTIKLNTPGHGTFLFVETNQAIPTTFLHPDPASERIWFNLWLPGQYMYGASKEATMPSGAALPPTGLSALEHWQTNFGLFVEQSLLALTTQTVADGFQSRFAAIFAGTDKTYSAISLDDSEKTSMGVVAFMRVGNRPPALACPAVTITNNQANTTLTWPQPINADTFTTNATAYDYTIQQYSATGALTPLTKGTIAAAIDPKTDQTFTPPNLLAATKYQVGIQTICPKFPVDGSPVKSTVATIDITPTTNTGSINQPDCTQPSLVSMQPSTSTTVAIPGLLYTPITNQPNNFSNRYLGCARVEVRDHTTGRVLGAAYSDQTNGTYGFSGLPQGGDFDVLLLPPQGLRAVTNNPVIFLGLMTDATTVNCGIQ